MISMRDVPLKGRRVLIREDLNTPIRNGEVQNAARIEAALPTIRHCVAQGAAVMVASHVGRPTPGQWDSSLSLAHAAELLGEGLGQEVPLVALGNFDIDIAAGQAMLLENIRFLDGELANDDDLARRLAAPFDVFVMDAFATAHRAHASTHGVAKHAAIACAGPLLEAEVAALQRALANPARPLVAVVGGAKASSKLRALEALADIADRIIVGGGVANVFLVARGWQVGASLLDADLVDVARRIEAKVEVLVPEDVMTARGEPAATPAVLRRRGDVAAEERILDIGPASARAAKAALASAGTILWSGPLGMFELDHFGEGTRVVAEAIAESAAFSIAGGGDTIAAIDKNGARDGLSYISTGGGAFLEFVEGKPLPAIEMLKARAR